MDYHSSTNNGADPLSRTGILSVASFSARS